MPCYDGREAKANEDRKEYVKWLEAALCAVCSSLERKGICHKVLAEASRHGKINLVEFWAEHQKTDETRLAHAIHQYSKDEQEVILGILLSRESLA